MVLEAPGNFKKILKGFRTLVEVFSST